MHWDSAGNKTGTDPPPHRANLRERSQDALGGGEARQGRAGASADATEGQVTAVGSGADPFGGSLRVLENPPQHCAT